METETGDGKSHCDCGRVHLSTGSVQLQLPPGPLLLWKLLLRLVQLVQLVVAVVVVDAV